MISGEIPQAERASYVWQCTVEAVCGHVTAKMAIQIIKNIPGYQFGVPGIFICFRRKQITIAEQEYEL